MSSISHDIGSIFQPLLKAVADLLAILYSVIPRVPGGHRPVDHCRHGRVSRRSPSRAPRHDGHQRPRPEMKKLQQKYKGRNRERSTRR